VRWSDDFELLCGSELAGSCWLDGGCDGQERGSVGRWREEPKEGARRLARLVAPTQRRRPCRGRSRRTPPPLDQSLSLLSEACLPVSHPPEPPPAISNIEPAKGLLSPEGEGKAAARRRPPVDPSLSTTPGRDRISGSPIAQLDAPAHNASGCRLERVDRCHPSDQRLIDSPSARLDPAGRGKAGVWSNSPAPGSQNPRRATAAPFGQRWRRQLATPWPAVAQQRLLDGQDGYPSDVLDLGFPGLRRRVSRPEPAELAALPRRLSLIADPAIQSCEHAPRMGCRNPTGQAAPALGGRHRQWLWP